MDSKHGPASETVRHWSACSDAYLQALGHLPDGEPGLALPRVTLTSLALECRLKAFICAARGGAPGTGDLARLVTLAAHCGLVLTADELQRIVSLDRAADTRSAVDARGREWVEQLCDSISRQVECVAT